MLPDTTYLRARLLLIYHLVKRECKRTCINLFRVRWGRASLPDVTNIHQNGGHIRALPLAQHAGKKGTKVAFCRSHSLNAADNMKFTVTRYNSVPGTEEMQATEEKVTDHHNNHIKPGFGRSFSAKLRRSPSMESVGGSTMTAQPGEGDFSNPMARRGRMFANRQKRRFIFKDGECNISLSHVTRRRRRYFGDMFTTLLDMRWRYNLLMFALAFVLSWVIFALLWWIILLSHKDHLHADDTDGVWVPCMTNVYDFPTALLFSIETQHTIGYGFRAMEPKCPEAFFLLMIQSCFGVFMQSLMTGIIFAKLSRPKGRSHTIKFTKCAVICQRDGEYCMLFRVADMRKSHIVGVTIRALLVKNRITKEGELLPLSQFPLEVVAEHGDNNLFLVWPVTLVHKIDEKSPLWNLNAESLITERFEVVVILEGTVESSGMTTQVRTSYLPWEILWGHRLAPLVTYQKENGQYKIDYSQFHATNPVAMPECSAKQFNEGYKESDDEMVPTSPVTLCPRMYRQLSLETSFSSDPIQCQSLTLTHSHQQPKKKRFRNALFRSSFPKRKVKRTPVLRPEGNRQNGVLKRLPSKDITPVETIPEVTIAPLESTHMLESS